MKTKIEAIEKVGLFGGSFNPFHVGHINAIQAVQKALDFDRVIVLPAAQNPQKEESVDGPTGAERLEMVRLGLKDLEFVELDEQELFRGGKSYTVDTVEHYSKLVAPENLFLIVGMDQFENFDTWKNFEKILKLANLIVVSRPGFQLPFAQDDLPKGLQKMVVEMERQFVQLTTERTIEFLQIKNSSVSASEVRKKLRSDRNVDQLVPMQVEEFIRSSKLYAPLKEKIGDYEKFTHFCADVLFSRKALALKGYNLKGLEAPTDFTLIASGTSTRHASSLAENLIMAVKEEFNVRPQAVEGLNEGRWIVLDYGVLIVHLFYDFVRQEYQLEELWRSAKPLTLVEKPPVSLKG